MAVGKNNSVSVEIFLKLLNDARVQAKLREIVGTTKVLKGEVKKLDVAEEKLYTTEKRLANALAQNNAMMQGRVKTITRVRQVQDKFGKTQGYITTQTKQLTTAQGNVVATTKILNDSTKKQVGMWGGLNPQLDKANKFLNNLRWSMVNLMFAMAAIGAVLSPFILLTKYGMELESLFKRIEVVTGTAMETAKAGVERLRAGTMFSMEEMGKAFLEFSKQGFNAADTMQALPSITALATVGFTDLDTATRIVAQTMHEFGLKANDAAHIADVLAAAANQSAADVETFGVAMSYAGPIAAQAGLSFEETAAALSILSNMGLSASKAGTSFAAALTKIMRLTEDTKETMKELGISFFDSTGQMKDMDTIVRELSAVLGDLPDEERLEFLVQTFGRRGARAISGFMTALETGQGTISTFTTAIDQQNYAIQRMEDVHTTTAARLKTIWNDVKMSFNDVGTAFNNMLANMLEDIQAASLEKRMTKIRDRMRQIGMEGAPTIAEIIGVGKMPYAGGITYGEALKVAPEAAMVSDVLKKTAKALEEQGAIGLMKVKEMLDVEEKRAALMYSINKALSEQAITLDTQIEGLNMGVGEYINLLYRGVDAQDILTQKGREYSNALNQGVLFVDNLTTVSSRAQNVAELIKKEYERGGVSLEKITGLTENQRDELRKILDGEISINTVTLEQLNFWKEIYKAIFDANQELIKMETAQTALVNKAEELAQKYAPEVSKELQRAKDAYEDLQALRDKMLAVGAPGLREITLDLFGVGMSVYQLEQMEDRLDSNKERLEFWEKAVESANDEIRKQTTILRDYQEQLREVDDEIRTLSRPRFTGQLGIERLINKVELAIKKQELADRGIADAQSFLQEQLALSSQGYDKLYESIERVNQAVERGEDTYTAWKETVQEFIYDTIKAGEDLGEDVTEHVRKFQTLLLSTSRFGGAEGEFNRQEEYLSLLRDAYDIHYGAMEDDVRFAIQAHEEEGAHIFESSAQVVNALQSQWKEHDRLSQKVESVSEKVDVWKDKLSAAKTKVDFFRDAISQLSSEMDRLVKAIEQVVLKQSQIALGKPFKSSSQFGGENQAFITGTGIGTRLPSGGYLAPGVVYKGSSFDDFVMRPGQEPVKINPNDTLIGFQGAGGLGTITIQNINISGVSGDPEEFAYEFTKALKRELRTI